MFSCESWCQNSLLFCNNLLKKGGKSSKATRWSSFILIFPLRRFARLQYFLMTQMISREKIKNAFLNHKSARGYTVLDSTKTISKRLEHQLFHVLIILILAARDSVHFSSNRDASSSFSFF